MFYFYFLDDVVSHKEHNGTLVTVCDFVLGLCKKKCWKNLSLIVDQQSIIESIDVQRLHIEKMARMLETLLDTNNNNNNNITK